jgi:hypothetical protein
MYARRTVDTAEAIARAFHERYEAYASEHGYETRPESACAWEDVPENNRALMVHVAAGLVEAGVIEPGPAIRVSTFPGPPAVALEGQTTLDDISGR